MGLFVMPGPFLKSWVATNVRDVPPGDRAEQASRLAAKCIADAAMCGIFIDDLEQAAGGSVLNYIADAIAAGEDQTIDRLMARVRPKVAKAGPQATG